MGKKSTKAKIPDTPAPAKEDMAAMMAATGAPTNPDAAAAASASDDVAAAASGTGTAAGVSPLDLAFATGDNPGYLRRLYAQLYNAEASRKAMAARAGALKVSPEVFGAAQQKFFENPLSMQSLPITDKVNGSAFGNTMRLIGANIKAHPWQALGTGTGIAANIAGAVDNDNFLGQGIGLGAGALLGSKVLKLSPYGSLNAALIGGGLGSLFDTLTEAKEKRAREEREAMAKLPAKYTTY